MANTTRLYIFRVSSVNSQICLMLLIPTSWSSTSLKSYITSPAASSQWPNVCAVEVTSLKMASQRHREVFWKSLHTTEASLLSHRAAKKEGKDFFSLNNDTLRNIEINEMSKLWKDQTLFPPPLCPHIISQIILNVISVANKVKQPHYTDLGGLIARSLKPCQQRH